MIKQVIKYNNFRNHSYFREYLLSDKVLRKNEKKLFQFEYELKNKCACTLTRKYSISKGIKYRIRDYDTTFKGVHYNIKIVESMDRKKIYSTWNVNITETLEYGSELPNEKDLITFMVFIYKLVGLYHYAAIICFEDFYIETIKGYTSWYNYSPNKEEINEK